MNNVGGSGKKTLGPRVAGAPEPEISRAGYFLLLAYLVIEYVRPQYFVPAIGIVRPGMVLAISLTFYWMKNWGPTLLVQDPLIRYFAMFTAFAVLWVPFAHNNYFAFERAQSLLIYILAATVSLSIVLSNRHWRHRFLEFWIAVHTYLALFALTHAGRGPGSFLTDENDLALALCVGMPYPFLVAQAKQISGLRRLYYLSAVLLMIMGVIWTNSRGGFIGLAAVLMYMLWLSKHRVRNLVLVGMLATVALFVAPDSYLDEVRSISDTEDSTRNQRLHQWRIAWAMFLDNPVLGVGPGNYPWRVGEYQRSLDTFQENERIFGGRAAHSLYFTLFSETGLVGTTLYVLILVNIFRRMGRLENFYKSGAGPPDAEKEIMIVRAVKASMIGYLSAGVFISVLYYPHLWYAIGLVAAFGDAPAAARGNNPKRVGRVA